MNKEYNSLLGHNTSLLWNLLLSLNASRCDVRNVSDASKHFKSTQMDAFFYIVVVLVFYASSIVLLLIKYSRKDDEEKFLNHQFAEFVKRDRFQAAQYKNRIALVRTKEVLANLDEIQKTVPKIMIHSCSDVNGSSQNVFADSNNEGERAPSACSSADESDKGNTASCEDLSEDTRKQLNHNVTGLDKTSKNATKSMDNTTFGREDYEILCNTSDRSANGCVASHLPDESEVSEVSIELTEDILEC